MQNIFIGARQQVLQKKRGPGPKAADSTLLSNQE